MNRATNLGPAPAATQEQRSADILVFAKSLPPGPRPYVQHEYARLRELGEIVEIIEISGRLKANQPPPGSVGGARVAHQPPDTFRDLPFHPEAERFPLMSDAELKTLAEDIDKNGQQEPIKTLDGMILVGRNRFRACQMRGLTPWIEPISESFNGDPRSFVLSSNLHRKHLNWAQIAWVGYQYTQLNYGEALTQAEAASLTGINIDQIRSAAAIDRVALPEIKAAIQNGEIGKIGHAYKIVTLEKDERLDGLTSEQKQINWLNNRAVFGGARTLRKPAFPITAKQINALTDQEALALITKLIPKAERALEPGMQIFIGEKP